jgi:hypothetical protein
MEGVVVEVRVRAPCNRFANKGNGICNRTARGFDSHKANLHSFFPLRTIRVVTRGLDRLSGHCFGCLAATAYQFLAYYFSRFLRRPQKGLP